MFGFFKRTPEVDEVYELKEENPFKRGRVTVKIIEVKENWVKYKYKAKVTEGINTGVEDSRPVSKFLKLYRKT